MGNTRPFHPLPSINTVERLPPPSVLGFLLLLPALLSGCGSEVSQGGFTVRDSAGISIAENKASRWEEGEGWMVGPDPTLDIGVMDGDPEYQFFQIAGSVRMPDGRLAVANSGSGEIRFYDAGGTFLRSSGQKGDGPGEFQDIFFLRKSRGDSLLAYDWDNRRMSVMDTEGRFARSFELTVLTTSGGFPIVSSPYPDGSLLLGADMFLASGEATVGTRRDSAMYYHLGPEGQVINTLGAYPGGESYQTANGDNWVGGGLVFGRTGYAAASGEGFYYGSSDRYEIEYRNRGGDLLRIIRLDQENMEVTQADIDGFIADRMERARPERRPIYEIMFRDMPFPSQMPAYGEFIVDEAGNLWVGEYRRPGDDQPRWKIFDPRGVYLGVVETPPGLRIYEIGMDYVLGRWSGDLEVEHIRMYALQKG
jgi:hypothetical protein